jgi:hypothetical protein
MDQPIWLATSLRICHKVPTLRGLWAGIVRCCCWPAESSQGQQFLPHVMEADEGRRLAGIEVADDGACDLPVEILKGVGLGVDRGGSCAGSEGAILRFLNHE